jgi:D-ribose pyranase
MLKSGIIHPELAKMLASMGHGDILLVTDAGFPIPRTAWRIDLAIVPDFPDLVSILSILHDVFIAERVSFAQEVIERNQ